VLGILVLCVYLNEFGAPAFVQRHVEAWFEQRGWNVQFSRLRLRWYRGLVAENLQVEQARSPAALQFYAEEAECSLRFSALAAGAVEPTAVKLVGGRLVVPMTRTNTPGQQLLLQDIRGEVRIQPNDVWDLFGLEARGLGLRIAISGWLTNASALRAWRPPARPPPGETGAWRERMWDILRQMQFGDSPELMARFNGDLLKTNSFHALMRFKTDRLTSPWAKLSDVIAGAVWMPPDRAGTNFSVDLRLTARQAGGSWGQAGGVDAHAWIELPGAGTWPTNAHVAMRANTARTPWASGEQCQFRAEITPGPSGSTQRLTTVMLASRNLRTEVVEAGMASVEFHATHSPRQLFPADLAVEAEATDTRNRWGTAHRASLTAHGTVPAMSEWRWGDTNAPLPVRWENAPFETSFTLVNAAGSNLTLRSAVIVAGWQAPRLSLQLNGHVNEGLVSVNAAVDAVTRVARFDGTTALDPKGIVTWLPESLQRTLSTYTWKSAPFLQAHGGFTLPAWTDPAPDWAAALDHSLAVEGRFAVGSGTHHGVTFETAESPFAFSNKVWRLFDLQVRRPEGRIYGEYTGDLDSGDFHWRVRGRIDPQGLKPVLTAPSLQQLIDDFQWTEPPFLAGDLRGNWHDPERLQFDARAGLTNFVFRGETVKDCDTGLYFTNSFLSFLSPQLRREGEVGRAEGIGVDFPTDLLYLTNAMGNLDPYALTRAIGSAAARAIEPYQFAAPPLGRAWGRIDLTGKKHRDDIHFVLGGGDFRWQDFHLAGITGRVDWAGQTVALEDVRGAFYGGEIAGQAFFDLAPTNGAQVRFHTFVTNAALPTLMFDLSGKSNQLEGRLTGELEIRNARLGEPFSWEGRGAMHLTNGLLWDIPIFGIFSPVLNSLAPGAGNSRARRANASFIITNSVIYSTDLEIDATAMRMQYDLSVDFDRRIEGRVEAELLRNVPGVGLIISKVLWPVTKLFEYKLSGTLDKPRAVPLLPIPRLILMPFRPIKTLKELVPEEKPAGSEKPGKPATPP
jgi:hypothetical protein